MSAFSRRFIALLLISSVSVASYAQDPCSEATVVDIWSGNPLPDLQAIGEPAQSSLGKQGDRGMHHVWVIDHSGSMYADYSPMLARSHPYYVEIPEFQNFVSTDLSTNFHDNQDQAAVVAFNEYGYVWDGTQARRLDGGNKVPFESVQVTTRSGLKDLLGKLPPPPYGMGSKGFPAPVPGAIDCSVRGAASNCSKMMEGLKAAQLLLDETGEGIIWLVTDNIYEGGQGSQDLSKAEVDENRLFYQAIRDTPEFRVVVAYPVVNSGVGSSWLRGSSLFIYGIYYDKDLSHHTPVEEVRRLLGDGSKGVLISQELTEVMKGYSSGESPSPGRPFRFKPLDQDVVRISLATDVKQVRKHQEMGQEIKLLATVKIQNLLDHRVVDSLRFKVSNGKWVGYEPNVKAKAGTLMSAITPVCPGEFKSEEVRFQQPIKPGQSASVDVELVMPAVTYGIHSLNDLLQIAWNDEVVMGGALRADLLDVASSLSIDPSQFKGTYGAESLPEVFKNPQVRAYTAQFLARTEKIENPGTMLALLISGGVVVLGGLGMVGTFMLTSVSRRLVIDGSDKGVISIPRLRSTSIERGGEEIARASLSFGGSIQLRGVRGYLARREGNSWVLTREGRGMIRVDLKTSR